MAAEPRDAGTFDPTRAEAFAERMLGVLNSAALAMMTSIGHRTGLFDALARESPATSEALARAAGLDERYVREWLAAVAAGRLVEFDPVARTYALPPEHAAALTRAASPGNLAAMAQYFPVLGSVEDDLVACFRGGGGVPYARFGRFHDVMAEDSEQTVLSALLSDILPLAPDAVERLERGARAADLGCGQGRALLRLAERFPRSTFTGVDLSDEAIAVGRAEARARGLANVTFAARDLSRFDREAEPEALDLVTTFDAVHDQARPGALLAGIRRTLRPGGVYLMQDVDGSSELAQNLDRPLAPLLYAISTMHCMTVSLAQGGEGLGTMWGVDRAEAMLRDAGFRDVRVHRLPHDIQNAYLVARA